MGDPPRTRAEPGCSPAVPPMDRASFGRVGLNEALAPASGGLDAPMRPFPEMTPMRALITSLALLTAFAAAAQTSPPSGQALGSSPPGSARIDERSSERYGRGGGRSTLVVVDRDELEQRLARLESLLRNAERGGGGRGRLDEAYRELSDVRNAVSRAPEARGYEGGGYGGPARPPPMPAPPPAPASIAEPRLRDLISSMSRESFAANKLRVLEAGARGDYFVVGQVTRMVDLFSFSADRLAVVRMLWPRVLDPQNGYQLHGSFPHSKDKEELQRIIAR